MDAQSHAVARELPKGRIEGFCDPRFAEIAEEFERNFKTRGEVGASVCLSHEGRTLVDLWGGVVDREGKPWNRDTVSIVFSATKGATALCAHVLAGQGKLDIEAPVATYWPEYATNGKEKTTVHMFLDHSAPSPVWRTRLTDEEIYTWDRMVEVLAGEEAFWEPGTTHGYHALTIGWTVGEVVRRISGQSLGDFFQSAVAKPLGIDFWIGTPEEVEPRIAPMIFQQPKDDELMPFARVGLADRKSIPGLFLFNSGALLAGGANTREAHAAQLGGASGITNARGLAGMYAPLANGGSLNGVKLVDADGIMRMSRVSSASHYDQTLCAPTRFALGYMKSMDNRALNLPGPASCLIGEPAFGHVGAGGSIGFADPEAKLSFGYTMNKMGLGLLLNDRGQSLVDAAYRCLGYRSNASGAWIK
jgi:CubicO group peptidase (beta-lactamase class C family)